MSYEREEGVEEHLKEVVESVGGVIYKMVPAGIRGVPDRIVCVPWHKPPTFFIETKAPSVRKLRTQQKIRHAEIQLSGGMVLVLNTKQKITDYFDQVKLFGQL